MISKAIGTARRSVAITLGGTAIALLLLTAERLSFERAFSQAADRVRTVEALNTTVLKLDMELTTMARLAAASGDTRWKADYERTLQALYRAIEQSQALADPAMRTRYDRATVAANDALVVLEDAAFRALAEGRRAEALALLTGADYERHKAVLAAGSDALAADITARAGQQLEDVRRDGLLMLGALIGLTLLGALWLWRSLNRGLSRARAIYQAQDSQIRDLALNDPLTGLANRRGFQEGLATMLQEAYSADRGVGLLIVDLDRFKLINDRNGHHVGDRVLIEAALRLRDSACAQSLVARLGGDEFVLVCPVARNDVTTLPRLAEAVISRLGEPILIDGDRFTVGATIGGAQAPRDSSTADDLLRKADVALYRGKAEGRGSVSLFTAAMDQELRERTDLEHDLRLALAEGQIVPYYQPLMDLDSGRITGFEALARWHHPKRGLLPPAVFLPLAEELGLIGEVSLTILRQACFEMAGWDRALTLAVNIAPAQLQDPWLPEKLMAILAETRFPTSRLEIEITEDALIEDFETAKAVVSFLKDKHIRVALDDFGTGYSSLSHLSSLAFDKIKIDQSFVRGLADNPDGTKIIAAIINLGSSLGLPTIAEGVETSDHVAMLQALGCRQAQGYLFSRPVPADQALALARGFSLAEPAEGAAPLAVAAG